MSASKQAMIRAGEYRDAGTLLALTRHVEAMDGVLRVVAMMATPGNQEVLRKMGMAPDHWPATPKPGDLLVLLTARDDASATAAMERCDAWLSARPAAGALVGHGAPSDDAPRTLAQAMARQPESRLAVVSVPGPFAAREAKRALEHGLSVLLTSDGVTVEEEVSLKTLADARGLMVMGPECGGVLLDGVPLGFANAVRRGGVGVVAASGTGLQELTTLLHRLGAGVSHAVGTGDRDLTEAVGGRTTLTALDRLASDASTRVLVLLARQCSREVALRAVERAAATGRPVVAYFVGEANLPAVAGVTWATSVADAAWRAAEASGVRVEPWEMTSVMRPVYAPSQRWLRALYVGATLCAEAVERCRHLAPLTTNLTVEGVARSSRFRVAGHHLLDLGDAEYTRGRTHPAMDPSLRVDAIYNAANDESVAVLLLDVVLGYGAHPDPVGAMRDALVALKERSRARGAEVEVVAVVVGTDDDGQRRSAQVAALTALGVRVMPEHAAAVTAALALLPEEG